MSPVLFIHICGGTLGLVSGAAAMSFGKGSRGHVIAGRIFVVSMLIMSTGATFLGVQHHEPGNVSGGIFTAYLILTGWFTAQRGNGTTRKFDWMALLIPLALGLLTWYSGIEKLRTPGRPKDGVPAGMNFFLGCVLLLAAVGDLRMLASGGIIGAKRIARHL